MPLQTCCHVDASDDGSVVVTYVHEVHIMQQLISCVQLAISFHLRVVRTVVPRASVVEYSQALSACRTKHHTSAFKNVINKPYPIGRWDALVITHQNQNQSVRQPSLR